MNTHATWAWLNVSDKFEKFKTLCCPNIAEVLESYFSFWVLLQVWTHYSLLPASFQSNGMKNSLLCSRSNLFWQCKALYIVPYRWKEKTYTRYTFYSHISETRPPRSTLYWTICRWYVPSLSLHTHIKNFQLWNHSHL